MSASVNVRLIGVCGQYQNENAFRNLFPSKITATFKEVTISSGSVIIEFENYQKASKLYRFVCSHDMGNIRALAPKRPSNSNSQVEKQKAKGSTSSKQLVQQPTQLQIPPSFTFLRLVLEYELVDDTFQESLTCAICMNIYVSSSSIPCGHIFCKNCIVKCLSHRKECPLCKSKATTKDITKAFKIEEILDKMNVYCLFRNEMDEASGCSWKGKKSELEEHLKHCEMRSVKCDNCNWTGPRKQMPIHTHFGSGCKNKGCEFIGTEEELKNHANECGYQVIYCVNQGRGCRVSNRKNLFPKNHENSCVYRVVKCKYCRKTTLALNEEHHKKTCEKIPVKCSNAGCSIIIPREEFQAHSKTVCPYRKENCKYCKGKYCAKDLSQHQSLCAPKVCSTCRNVFPKSEFFNRGTECKTCYAIMLSREQQFIEQHIREEQIKERQIKEQQIRQQQIREQQIKEQQIRQQQIRQQQIREQQIKEQQIREQQIRQQQIREQQIKEQQIRQQQIREQQSRQQQIREQQIREQQIRVQQIRQQQIREQQIREQQFKEQQIRQQQSRQQCSRNTNEQSCTIC